MKKSTNMNLIQTFLVALSLLMLGCKDKNAPKDLGFQYTYDKLDTKFQNFVEKKGVKISKKMRVTSGWYENIFIAHTGIKSDVRYDAGRPLSILLIEGDDKRRFQNHKNDSFSSGIYLVKAFIRDNSEDGYINIEDLKGNSVVSVPLRRNGGLGCGVPTTSCDNITNVSIHFGSCEICLDWTCESGCYISCIKIGSCDVLTGVLNRL